MAEAHAKVKRRRGLRVLGAAAVCALITAAAVTLLANAFFPVLRVRGNTMSPTLFDGDVVVAAKRAPLQRGDICVFREGESLQCKRVIGVGGDSVDIDEQGSVYVGGQKLDEPYLSQKTTAAGTLELPASVPQGSYFVMGDNRRASVDSRSEAVGFVNSNAMVGEIVLRVLPLPGIPA